VQVLEEEDERSLGRNALQEALPGRERLLALGGPAAGEPDQRSEARVEPDVIGFVSDGGAQPRLRAGGSVRLEDAGLRLDDLAERPEGDALPVGQAPPLAPEDQLRAVVDPRAELGEQTRLADSRLAGEGDELDVRLPQHALERIPEEAELVLTADEGRRGRRGDADATARAERSPERYGPRLTLDGDGHQLLVLDQRTGPAVGLLADHEGSDRRHALEARGGVDDVACGDSLALAGPGTQRDDRLTGRDRGPDGKLEPFLLVQLLDRVEYPEGCANGALGVVLVRERSSEHRHDRVTHELLDGPVEALDLASHPRVVGAKRGADILGIGPVGTGCELDQVDEEDRDDLPFLARRRDGLERSAAGEAEAGAVRVLLSTIRAGHDPASVRTRHEDDTVAQPPGGYRRRMDEARAVLARLDRIEELESAGAPPRAGLLELRALLAEAEAWVRVEPRGTELAEDALERCREALREPGRGPGAPAGLC
jgi:hypothetical protein